MSEENKDKNKEMMVCINCGKEFPKQEQFQIVTGARIEKGLCEKCFIALTKYS